MNQKLITIAFLAAFSVNTQAGEQFYKWVDDRGITHYSQSPPDDSKIKTEIVNVRTRIPMDSEAAISKLEKQRSDNLKAKTEDSKEGVHKTGEKAVATNTGGQDKDKCEKLQQELQTLSDKAGRLKVQNEKGEMHTMTEEERQQRQAETQKKIKVYCE